LGAKRKNLKDRTSLLVAFKAASPTVIEQIDILATREGITSATLLNRCWEEYWEKHGKGNSQTLLESHLPGGEKSVGQVEQEIVNYLKKNRGKDIDFKEIVDQCKSFGLTVTLIPARNIAKQLQADGYKVWR